MPLAVKLSQVPKPLACVPQNLAATPPNSEERFQARRLLPGMAKRLREVPSALIVLLTCISCVELSQFAAELSHVFAELSSC